MDNRIISVTDYGFFLVSMKKLESFLKEKKIRVKNLLKYLDKNKINLFEASEKGILLPVNQISSFDYQIYFSMEHVDSSIFDEWEICYSFDDFNFEITDNEFWLISFNMFNEWNPNDFKTTETFVGSYIPTGASMDLFFYNHGLKYNLPNGKYKVTVEGLKRKQLTTDDNKNFGFSIYFRQLGDAENVIFTNCRNPLECTFLLK